MSLPPGIKAHHDEKIAGMAMASVEVPEWDLVVYYKPIGALNGFQYNRLVEAAQKQNYESLVDVLILRALKEDGTKLFTSGDKKELMYIADAEIVARISNEMDGADGQSEADSKK